MSSKASIAFEVVTPLVLVAGLTGNIIICSLIITNKKLRTTFNYLLLNLAVSDLLCSLLGTLFYPGQIRNHYFSDGKLMQRSFEGTVCKVTTASIDLTTKNSVLTLAAISTDRFMAIVHPWWHKKAMSKRNIRFLLVAIWLVAVGSSLPMMLLMAKLPDTFQENSVALCLSFLMNESSFKVVAFVDLIAAYIIPMAIILRTSLAIIKHLWCHCSREPPEEASQIMLLKSRKRITRIVFSVIIAFNIFWLPWAIVEGSLLIGALQEVTDKTFVIMSILVFASASVNPILYSLQSRQFRNEVKKMFGCG